MAFQQTSIGDKDPSASTADAESFSIETIDLSGAGGRTEWQPHLRGPIEEIRDSPCARPATKAIGELIVKVELCPSCDSEDLLQDGRTGERFCNACGTVIDYILPEGCGAVPKLKEDEPVEKYDPEEGGITIRDERRNRIWNDKLRRN